MSDPIKEALALLDDVKKDVAKNSEALARVDQMGKEIKQTGADLTLVREEVKKLQGFCDERDKTIRELQTAGRIQRMDLSPDMRKEQAVAMLGMVIRRELCRSTKQEVPSAFKQESDAIARFEQSEEFVLARATLAYNAAPGSYLLPTVLETAIISALAAVSPLVDEMDYVPNLPLAGSIKIPVLTARPKIFPARASVDTAMTASALGWSLLSLTPQEAYTFVPVDNNLLMLSPLQLGQIVMQTINDAVIQGIADWARSADGTTNYNSITGLLNETNADYVISLPAGKTAFVDLDKAQLVAAKQKVLWQYWSRGKWLMNLEVLGVIEDINRLGKTPVVTDGPDGNSRVLRNEVVMDAWMPTSAATKPDTGFAGFGDLKSFIVGVAGGIRLASSTDYLFGSNQTCFRATWLMDIQRKPVKSFVLLKTAKE